MRYISLMTRQIQDLVQLVKLKIMIQNIFLPKWDKILYTHEKASLKTAKTHIEKVVENLQSRMDDDSIKNFLFAFSNTSIIHVPRKELEQSLKVLDHDNRILDYALKNCNPCKNKNPDTCELKQALEEAKYPAIWESDYVESLMFPLEYKYQKCMNHCKYCVNIDWRRLINEKVC